MQGRCVLATLMGLSLVACGGQTSAAIVQSEVQIPPANTSQQDRSAVAVAFYVGFRVIPRGSASLTVEKVELGKHSAGMRIESVAAARASETGGYWATHNEPLTPVHKLREARFDGHSDWYLVLGVITTSSGSSRARSVRLKLRDSKGRVGTVDYPQGISLVVA